MGGVDVMKTVITLTIEHDPELDLSQFVYYFPDSEDEWWYEVTDEVHSEQDNLPVG